MKINNVGNNGTVDLAKIYGAQQKSEKQASPVTAAESVETDRLEISAEAKAIQAYKAKLEGIPNVRADLVASIAQRIKNGTYVADARKIAEGMIRERLLDKLV
ncbi:MAG: flagellar biosynthesis anti-sigma factor FlgM [Bacillota bacterium]